MSSKIIWDPKAGSILTIILNTKDATVMFIKNEEESNIVCSEIGSNSNVRYKLSIKLYTNGDSTSMVDFSSDYVS